MGNCIDANGVQRFICAFAQTFQKRNNLKVNRTENAV